MAEQKMAFSEIAPQRLFNQQIACTGFQKPSEIVGFLGAVQAQDFGAATWAIGLRLPASNKAAIEEAFDDGAILRTHVLRPTWHFVAPADLRWMLELSAPRVHQANAYYYRKLELESSVFKPACETIVKALEGGKHLTRAELAAALEHAGIATGELRLVHLMAYAELESVVCSGSLRGKHMTYALLDERVPAAPSLTRGEALAELTKRYFTSRGPATIADFVWWSGLTASDAKTGVQMLEKELVTEKIDGSDYYFAPPQTAPVENKPAPEAYLLPNFDEYIVGYKDRGAAFDPQYAGLVKSGNAVFNNSVVIDGKISGTWRRTVKKQIVTVETNPFVPFNNTEQQAVLAAAERYREFFEKAKT